MDIAGALCIDRREVGLTLIPMFRLRATATIAISIVIAKAGVGVEASLVATAFVPVLTFGLDTAGGLRAAFEMRLVLQPFAITFFAFVQFFGFNFISFSFCLKWYGFIPVPKWCSQKRFVIYSAWKEGDRRERGVRLSGGVYERPGMVSGGSTSLTYPPSPPPPYPSTEWSAGTFDFKLFALSTGPYDVTPPKKGEVKVTQPDDASLVISHSGFVDSDSDIDHYEYALGTTPGGTSLIGWTSCSKDQTIVLQNSALGLAEGTRIYASIKAFNGELRTTVGSSPAYAYDNAAPAIFDFRVRRTYDGVWTTFTCRRYAPDGFCELRLSQMWLNATDELGSRFFFVEPVPDSNVTEMMYAVGTTPGGSDVADWADVGRADQLAAKSAEPLTVASTGLKLAHGRIYYMSVRTLNTRYFTGVFSSVQLCIDLVPPTAVYVSSFWPEDRRAWNYDTYVTPGWSFTDGNGSGVANHRWRLMAEDGFTEVVPPVESGPATQGVMMVALEHASWYCVQVQAQDWAGTWGENWEQRCFIVDTTANVWGPPHWLPMDPDAPVDDGWLMSTAADVRAALLARVVNQNRGDALSPNTLNETEWAGTEVTAAGEVAPRLVRGFRYELGWDGARTQLEMLPYVQRSFALYEPELQDAVRDARDALIAGGGANCAAPGVDADAVAAQLAEARALLAELEAGEAYAYVQATVVPE